MRYKVLNNYREKIISLPAPVCGMSEGEENFNSDKHRARLIKNAAAYAERVISREGLRADLGNLITAEDLERADSFSYTIMDQPIFYEGEYKKIAVVDFTVDNMFNLSHIFLLDSVGGVRNLGYLFLRASEENVFYKPTSFLFFSGAPKSGKGIYAFVKTECGNIGSEPKYAIYELGNDQEQWVLAYDFYVPTIYINGRGNRYEEAKAANIVSSKAPQELEPLNTIYGAFYSYYTSDGFSSTFRLPFSEIDKVSVICRVYYNINDYVEWTVAGDETSNTISFLDKEITFNIDRETGKFYFKEGNNNFAMPSMDNYTENNIRITASKEIKNGYNSVVSCRLAAQHGLHNVFSGGADKNRLFYCDYDNPLYFPYLQGNSVGEESSGITALCSSRDRLIIFKKDSIYRADVKDGDYINKTALLANNGRLFKKVTAFNVECINNKIGCKAPSTVSLLEDTPIWLGSDNSVYRLNFGMYNTIKLSQKVDKHINDFVQGAVSAEAMGNKYLLCCKNKMYIMEYVEGKAHWFYWEFPEKVTIHSGVACGGCIAFACESDSLLYTALLSGDSDRIMEGSFLENHISEYPIEVEIGFKGVDLGKGLKKNSITRLFARMKADEGLINISRGDLKKELPISKLSMNKELGGILLPINMPSREKVYITLKAYGSINLEDIDIYINYN